MFGLGFAAKEHVKSSAVEPMATNQNGLLPYATNQSLSYLTDTDPYENEYIRAGLYDNYDKSQRNPDLPRQNGFIPSGNAAYDNVVLDVDDGNLNTKM